MLLQDVQSDQPEEVAVLQTTDYAAAACGLLHQLCCGYAVFLPFARLKLNAADVSLVPLWTAMLSAALLIGVGAGLPLHSRFSRVRGIHVSARIGMVITAGGIILVTVGAMPWGTLAGCLLVGLGLFGEWTPSAEFSRRSLSSTHLWRGMRIHSVVLFVGALLAIVVVGAGVTVSFAASAVIALTCCGVAAVLGPTRECAAPTGSADVTHQTAFLLPTAAVGDSQEGVKYSGSRPPLNSGEGVSDGSIPEECCGDRPVWTPMPVWLGACIAFVGMYAFGAIFPALMNSVWQFPVILVVSGCLLGTVVFQAVVPLTGYAVLLLSACLAGIVVFGVSPWLPSSWSGLILPGRGAVAAAIWCGCSGLVGESFVDSWQHSSRTVVLMIGSLAAAATALVAGITATVVSPNAVPCFGAGIWFVAIFWLRKIPSPLISRRPEDELSVEQANRMLSESLGVAEGSAE